MSCLWCNTTGYVFAKYRYECTGDYAFKCMCPNGAALKSALPQWSENREKFFIPEFKKDDARTKAFLEDREAKSLIKRERAIYNLIKEKKFTHPAIKVFVEENGKPALVAIWEKFKSR